MTLPKWPRPNTLSNRNESIEKPICVDSAGLCIWCSLSLYCKFRATGRGCWRRFCDDVLLSGVFCALLASFGSNWITEYSFLKLKESETSIGKEPLGMSTYRRLYIVLWCRRMLNNWRLCNILNICADIEVLEWLYNLFHRIVFGCQKKYRWMTNRSWWIKISESSVIPIC